MKKIFIFICLSIALMIGQVHAFEFSIGISSPGFGLGFLRGSDADNIIDTLETAGFERDFGLSLFPLAQVNLAFMFETPAGGSVGLETGIGYGMSTVKYKGDISGAQVSVLAKREGLIIPILYRGQYEFSRGTIYALTGPTFVIPMTSRYASVETDSADVLVGTGISSLETRFSVDLGIAIGGEFRITGGHYIGLRAGYDWSLFMSHLESPKDIQNIEFYHDNLNLSLTYRYAFNSKWNKKY